MLRLLLSTQSINLKARAKLQDVLEMELKLNYILWNNVRPDTFRSVNRRSSVDWDQPQTMIHGQEPPNFILHPRSPSSSRRSSQSSPDNTRFSSCMPSLLTCIPPPPVHLHGSHFEAVCPTGDIFIIIFSLVKKTSLLRKLILRVSFLFCYCSSLRRLKKHTQRN